MDLLALVLRRARRRAATTPAGAALRGLNGQWTSAERGIMAQARGHPARLARLAQEFGKLAQACGEREALGRAARLHGSALGAGGHYSESLAAYRKAADLLGGAARDGARLGLAGSLLRLGRFDEAVDVCRQVRRAALRRGDRPLAAAAVLNQAVALHEGGDLARSVPLYRKARDEMAAAGARGWAASATQNLANALVLLDRFAEAEPLLRGAIRTFEELGSEAEAATCRYNLGALLAVTDRLGEADDELSRAERALRSVGDRAYAAVARLDRGETLLRARLLPEARHAVSTARRALRGGGPPTERARAVLLLARIAVAQGDAAGARRLLARPLPHETRATFAERSELRGRAMALDGRPAKGRALLERAATAFGRTHPAARSRALAAAAWCALQTGDLSAARSLSGRAEKTATRLGLPGLVHGGAAVRFLVEDAASRWTAADEALDRAFEALEQVRAGLGPERMRAALLRGSDAWFARAVRHVLAGPEGEAAALELVERWRARALVDLLGDAARVSTAQVSTAGGDVADLRARVAVLEQQLEVTDGPAFLREGSRPGPSSVARRLAVAEEKLRHALESDRSPRFGAPLRLAGLVRSVPPGTCVVSLFADERGGVAFVVRDGEVWAVHGLGAQGEVAALAEELQFRMGKFSLGVGYVERHGRRIRQETDRILARLAQVTLAPLADVLEASERLVVVPHGPWHRVPFAALPFGTGILADRVRVTLAPALASLTADVPVAAGPSLVLAVADERAPAIETEGRAVAAALPGSILLEGPAARMSAIQRPQPPRCVHIAAHGRFRGDAPGMSGVRLSDGWLRAVDFPSLGLDGTLVVLSGCNTGVSDVDAGGEVHGLVRGVLASGAADLVVSLWRVDDETTARFMAAFQAERARGTSSAQALRRVQTACASEGAHPWHWAGFVLWTRRLVKEPDLVYHRQGFGNS